MSGTILKSSTPLGSKSLSSFGTSHTAPPVFSRAERQEKKDEKINRAPTTLGNQFQKKTISRVSENENRDEALSDEDETEIPAFIRKKLGH